METLRKKMLREMTGSYGSGHEVCMCDKVCHCRSCGGMLLGGMILGGDVFNGGLILGGAGTSAGAKKGWATRRRKAAEKARERESGMQLVAIGPDGEILDADVLEEKAPRRSRGPRARAPKNAAMMKKLRKKCKERGLVLDKNNLECRKTLKELRRDCRDMGLVFDRDELACRERKRKRKPKQKRAMRRGLSDWQKLVKWGVPYLKKNFPDIHHRQRMKDLSNVFQEHNKNYEASVEFIKSVQ